MLLPLYYICAGCCAMATMIILLLTFMYYKSCGRRKDLCNIPSVSFVPLITIFVQHLLQQWKWLEPSEYFLQIFLGLCYLHRKERMIKLAWAGHYFILCFGVKEAEKILCSTSALDKERTYNIAKPWLGSSLIISKGEKWKTRRKMLTPAFHFQILRDFLVIFNKNSKILIEKLETLDEQTVYITKFLQLCTLDIMIESAMGLHLNAQGGDCEEYVKAVKHISSDVMQQIIKPWYWIKPIYNLSSVGRQVRKNINVTQEFTRKVISKRKAELLKEEAMEIIDDFKCDRTDFKTKKSRILLDLLLYYHLTREDFTEEDIREEVDSFMAAGYGATGLTITLALYLLGWHGEIQEKVYNELNHIFGQDRDRTVTTDDLADMKYLECVIKETLRLYPILQLVARQVKKDVEVEGYVVPANSSVVISIYSIHHDPSVFPNPEIFDPERFSLENCLKRHPYAYIPFLGGFRNCIGQRFAMMEMKTILTYILRIFKVRSLDHRDKVDFGGDVVLYPKTPIRLKLEKR